MVLTWIDYAVIAVYLLAITAFGSWFARFQKTTRDYFLTGRSVPWWAICFTIVATETSTLSFIGVPAGAYASNMTFLQLGLRLRRRPRARQRAVPAGVLPGRAATRRTSCCSAASGREVKNVAAVIFVITRTFADGIRLFATALVISVVTQVPVTVTVIALGAGDDRLHGPRRRVRGDLDRRGADVRLRRRGRAGVRRTARPDPRRLG